MLRNAASKVMWGGRATVFMVGLAVIGALLMVFLLAPPAHAFSTFTVNLTADTPDANLSNAVCDVNPSASGNQCTLRAAIQQANVSVGADTINFNISGTGVHTISPASALPVITKPVIINGYSQPGSSVNKLAKGTNAKLLIEINGNNAGGASGLFIVASDSVVKGLVINRFIFHAIRIQPEFGEGPAEVVTNVRIEGNFLGTAPTGTIARANGLEGVFISDGSYNTIGGTSPDKRNLISGNNFIGVDIEATAASGPISVGNTVQGNLIGTQKDGIHALGNGADGVQVIGDGAFGNRILSNSIFSNVGLGIDLVPPNGPTPNDSRDTDTGPNSLQNFPVLSSARTISGKTTIRGTLNSRPGAFYTLQFFSNPSGSNEGRRFIGQKVVSTNANGNVAFTSFPATAVPVGQTITATATRNTTGDTSEFSAPRTVVAG